MVRPRGLFKLVSACALLSCVAIAPQSLTRADDDANQPPVHRPQQKSLQQRIVEVQAGIRDANSKPTGPQTFKGPDLSDREKVVQALNRMSFGPTPGQVDEITGSSAGGAQAWIKQQLDPDQIDDSACEKYIAQKYPWVKMSITDIEKEYAERGQEKRKKGKDGKVMMMEEDKGPPMNVLLPQLVLERSVLSKRQFKEVMCEFWRNHFCVDEPGPRDEKSRVWTDADYEEQVIRKYAFGTFKEMLFASARHPAMLEYLDQKLSKANAWNENYAREVMELHTVGADQGYTNKDVQELSKVLTGWRYDDSYHFHFDPSWHQPGMKTWMGLSLPEGYEGGEKALSALCGAPRTATFISEKLCKFLLNDNPSPQFVSRIATVFRQTGGNLPKVYSAIILSPEFLSREHYRAKFKAPFFFTVSALRATQAKIENGEEICKSVGKMGEAIYNCPDPTGYRDVAESWMDAGVLTSRWQFAWDLVNGSIFGAKVPESFLARYKTLKSDEAEAKMLEDLIGGDVGDRELAALKEVAQNGDQARMVSIILGSPSFQQR